MLKPGERISFEASLAAYKKGQPQPAIQAAEECAERKALVAQWMGNLRLDTPDPVVNEMFAFSKIRAMESIYATKSGPMHGPGGESYYAAVWCNDQAEYINPFFPFVGYEYGNASALHSYKLFASFMTRDYRPIPSSIIAEGYDIWNGAGDRGDAAMCAYGASRYVLAKGDREEAQELWPFIEWCLEYCHRKLNPQGVVSSDTDELENRFPSGDANLCTSSLYYDALLSASSLARELGHSAAASRYTKQAATLRKSIDAFFAGNLNAIGKWEECVGSHHGTLQVELEIMSLFDGLLKSIDARGLADAAGNKLLVFSQDNRIAFAVLNNLVCKQKVVDLCRCDSFVSGLFEFGRHFNVIVALLNKGAVQACAHLHVGTIEWLDYQNYAVLFLL